MQLAIITPVAGMKRWATRSKVHLVLAQWLDDAEYWDFYHKRALAGDLVILDNGAYENMKPLEPVQYAQLIEGFKPSVAVLPDYPFMEPHHTVSASLRFLDRYGDLTTQWMFVPQTTVDNFNGWYQALNSVMGDLRVGLLIKWIGLPRNLHTHFGGIRPKVAAIVRTLYPQVHLHALGMGAGSIAEYEQLSGLVDTIDSSCAVWRGWNETVLGEQWNDIPMNLHAADPSENATQCIEANLILLGYGEGDVK